MHQQHVARRQISEQILPPPSETLNRLTPEPLLEILGDRPAQTAVAHLHLDYARALYGVRQATAHAFDFGKLGHWLIGSSLIGSSLTHSAPKAPALWSCPQRTYWPWPIPQKGPPRRLISAGRPCCSPRNRDW